MFHKPMFEPQQKHVVVVRWFSYAKSSQHLEREEKESSIYGLKTALGHGRNILRDYLTPIR